MKWTLCIYAALLFSCSHSQSESTSTDITSVQTTVLDSLGIELEVAQNPKFRFQMVATSIVRGEIKETISYGTDKYYYPASLVKIPAMMVLLEILKEKEISLNAVPVFDTVDACGSTKFVQLSQQKRISFRRMLRELIVVSDNHFYNALYHFITPKELNERLKQKGYGGVKIFRAFTGCDKIEQLRTYPCRVYESSKSNKIVFERDSRLMDSSILITEYAYSQDRLFGSKHENIDGDIVNGPYDLNYQIEIPLDQVHEMMLQIMWPSMGEAEHSWDVRSEDLTFVQELLGTFPSEISSAYRNLDNFDDHVYKYVAGLSKGKSRTYGKLGLSYGFASESVYIPSEGVENGVLLSYSVYVNSNDIVNDGVYDYETVARPFANDLFSKISEWHAKKL